MSRGRASRRKELARLYADLAFFDLLKIVWGLFLDFSCVGDVLAARASSLGEYGI